VNRPTIAMRVKRRRLLVALGVCGLAAPIALHAEQSRVARIGFLGAETASVSGSRLQALRTGLRELGYVEGKNLAVTVRWAEGNYDQLPSLANELAQLGMDVLVTDGDKTSVAAKQATSTVPIVVGAVGEPIVLGLVSSLSRPGGNITGSAFLAPELMVKRLELLKETMPRISRAGVLVNPRNATSGKIVEAGRSAAKKLSFELQAFEAATPRDIDTAMAAMPSNGVQAVVVQNETLSIANASRIANLAAKLRLALCGRPELAQEGALIGYGANNLEGFRRAAVYIDKILKGAKPGDLPFAQPSQFTFVLNMKTAKALGIAIPATVLNRADNLIQ
jgi:putative ABC transport system substrate-binding protein